MGTEFSSVSPEAEQCGAASAGHFAFPLFISAVWRGCFCSLDPDVFTCACLGWGCPIFLYMPHLDNVSHLQQGSTDRFVSPNRVLPQSSFVFAEIQKYWGVWAHLKSFALSVKGWGLCITSYTSEMKIPWIFLFAPWSIPSAWPQPLSRGRRCYRNCTVRGKPQHTEGFYHKSPRCRWQQVLRRCLERHDHPLELLTGLTEIWALISAFILLFARTEFLWLSPWVWSLGPVELAAGHSVRYKNNSTKLSFIGDFTVCGFPLSQRSWH